MVALVTGTAGLKQLFSALTEHTFQVELGIADPPLIDYISELLMRFVRIDAVHRYRDTIGRRLEEVADMLSEAEQRTADPQRELYRHIGDFTLFWAGLYPEALSHLQSVDRKDHLLDYYEQGKRSYRLASRFKDGPYREEAEVLDRLSQEFESCTLGLNCVRRELERLPKFAARDDSRIDRN
ncbi:MAG: hypothetical protein ACKVT0_04100 [Planctomycetaceae bacterium]